MYIYIIMNGTGITLKLIFIKKLFVNNKVGIYNESNDDRYHLIG